MQEQKTSEHTEKQSIGEHDELLAIEIFKKASVVDMAETPVERPKKSSEPTTAARRSGTR